MEAVEFPVSVKKVSEVTYIHLLRISYKTTSMTFRYIYFTSRNMGIKVNFSLLCRCYAGRKVLNIGSLTQAWGGVFTLST